jgi:hypothetical protein
MSENTALRPAVTLLPFLASVAALVFASWVVAGAWLPSTTFGRTLVFAFFICSPIGAFWMLYDCAVREKPPVVYYLIPLCLPYSFIWYYLVRVRPRRSRERSSQR